MLGGSNINTYSNLLSLSKQKQNQSYIFMKNHLNLLISSAAFCTQRTISGNSPELLIFISFKSCLTAFSVLHMFYHLFFFLVGIETSCPIIGEGKCQMETFYLARGFLPAASRFIGTQMYFLKLGYISSNTVTCCLYLIDKGNQVLLYTAAQDTSDNCWK